MLSLTHVDFCFGLLALLFYTIALAKTEDYFYMIALAKTEDVWTELS